MPGKIFGTQAQEFVLNLCEYFEMEKRNGGPLEPLSSVQERVAAALKIDRKTVYRIKKRKEDNPVLTSPAKHKPRPKLKTKDLKESSKMDIRNTLYNMYKESKSKIKHVTIKSLNAELSSKEIHSIPKNGYSDGEVIRMWEEALEQCSVEVWENCVRHTEKIIEDWYIREQALVNIEIEPIIINADENSDSESD
ncbi:hypothetical protein ABEB36_007960 [Hypothenemus hampei]|uniref:HTH psq-type domain-containing protein n=2 Tax=Hypothenemus hampei TaxID=57062 RepID=A0ABD1EVQ0_HYPHA